MEKNQMWEIIRKKSLENSKIKDKISNTGSPEDLSEIVNEVLCFSISDMINFASYFRSLDNVLDNGEEVMKDYLIEWFNKTS
jgi:hypothetical protein